MTTETTTAATKSADVVASKASKAAAAVSDSLPTVVDTVEVAMEVPAKVILNQKLVVTAVAVVGIAAGAAGLWGFQKLRARMAAKKLVQEMMEQEFHHNEDNEK